MEWVMIARTYLINSKKRCFTHHNLTGQYYIHDCNRTLLVYVRYKNVLSTPLRVQFILTLTRIWKILGNVNSNITTIWHKASAHVQDLIEWSVCSSFSNTLSFFAQKGLYVFALKRWFESYPEAQSHFIAQVRRIKLRLISLFHSKKTIFTPGGTSFLQSGGIDATGCTSYWHQGSVSA